MWKFERCVCQLHNQDWTINVILSQYYVLLGLFNGDYLTTFWLFWEKNTLRYTRRSRRAVSSSALQHESR